MAKSKKKSPEVRVTLSMFDTRDPLYRPARTDVPLDEFKPVSHDDYCPAGGTPLRDAVGRFVGHLSQLRRDDSVVVGLLLDESGSMGGQRDTVIESVNQFVEGLRDVNAVDKDAAGTVLCVIVTDGYENSSREIDHAALQKLLSSKESDGFTMIFLGAGIDAWDQGLGLGLSGGSHGQTVSHSGTAHGHAAAFASATSDAQAYLVSNASYHTSRASTSMRSITDDGDEILSNVNAS